MDTIRELSVFFYRRSLGLLLIRVSTGAVFIAHGIMKWQNLPKIEGFFQQAFGFPAWLTISLAVIEVLGGLMFILGIGTRVVGVVLGIEMLVAIIITGIGRGWSAHELEVLLMLLSFGLALAGSGRLRALHIFEYDHES
jgi:putative oxidoreductase